MNTRLCTLTTLLLLLGSADATAQVGIGIKGGGSMSTLHTWYNSNGTRMGLAAFAFLDVPVQSWLSLQPEVGFTQKGGVIDQISYVGDPVVPWVRPQQWRFDYIEWALLAHLRTSGSAGWPRVGLLVGPVWSRAVRRERQLDDGSTEELSDFRSDDLGLALGASLGNRRVGFELRVEAFGRDLGTATGAQWAKHIYGALLLYLRIR